MLIPSPRGVLCTVALVRLMEEAGFPAGAVNMVFGPPAVTEQVVLSDTVDMVSFTGSVPVGAKIMALAGQGIKKVVLELGGQVPQHRAAGSGHLQHHRTLGYALLPQRRPGVRGDDTDAGPQENYQQFVEETADFMSKLVVDDPHHDTTEIGPLITDEHRQRVAGFVVRAQTEGGEIMVGGGRPSDKPEGFFFEPTLIASIGNEAEVSQEELFAPVGVVLPYSEAGEAISLANQSRFGLNANIWGPTSEALAMAGKIRSGTVTINGGGGMRPDAPWGGYRESGVGREVW